MPDTVTTPPRMYGRSAFPIDEPLPPVLSGREVGAILGYGGPRSSQLKTAGAFDLFEILPRIGLTARYSGKKLQQWLNSELDTRSARVFGGTRRR
jgi:hypothetical protein